MKYLTNHCKYLSDLFKNQGTCTSIKSIDDVCGYALVTTGKGVNSARERLQRAAATIAELSSALQTGCKLSFYSKDI